MSNIFMFSSFYNNIDNSSIKYDRKKGRQKENKGFFVKSSQILIRSNLLTSVFIDSLNSLNSESYRLDLRMLNPIISKIYE